MRGRRVHGGQAMSLKKWHARVAQCGRDVHRRVARPRTDVEDAELVVGRMGDQIKQRPVQVLLKIEPGIVLVEDGVVHKGQVLDCAPLFQRVVQVGVILGVEDVGVGRVVVGVLLDEGGAGIPEGCHLVREEEARVDVHDKREGRPEDDGVKQSERVVENDAFCEPDEEADEGQERAV